MTDIWEKSQAMGDESVHLVADLEERPRGRIMSYELDPASEVSPEGEFPKHGQFLRVREWNGANYQGDEVHWECPAGLAEMIASEVDEKGGPADVDPRRVIVDVDGASKTSSGEWRFWADIEVRDET